MTKPIELRQRAAEDINAALDYYQSEGGQNLARRYIDALERALRHVARHPLTGSLRYSYELDVPELRARPLPKFPYLVFYIDLDGRVDVWRVLHAHRDIPEWFQVSDE